KKDIFLDIKKEYNRRAMEVYPIVKEIIDQSENKLETAVKIACAGNAIDLGILMKNQKNYSINIKKSITDAISEPFAINEFEAFENTLNQVLKQESPLILYIAD